MEAGRREPCGNQGTRGSSPGPSTLSPGRAAGRGPSLGRPREGAILSKTSWEGFLKLVSLWYGQNWGGDGCQGDRDLNIDTSCMQYLGATGMPEWGDFHFKYRHHCPQEGLIWLWEEVRCQKHKSSSLGSVMPTGLPSPLNQLVPTQWFQA